MKTKLLSIAIVALSLSAVAQNSKMEKDLAERDSMEKVSKIKFKTFPSTTVKVCDGRVDLLSLR